MSVYHIECTSSYNSNLIYENKWNCGVDGCGLHILMNTPFPFVLRWACPQCRPVRIRLRDLQDIPRPAIASSSGCSDAP